ncbi:hypothetical protein SAY86_008406 [Trapa natans]|uniref:LOB domain-containing protein n=1 Tax=Trapa natans TaxID=22666 RepID=A0AAN7KDQ5_TRANT|nr:hypothetical protein SAY86_008406 [Trapa natans]
MSCNGCRVLRKGCSDDCTLRPCLQWIKSPDAQGNATMFLAKFYGRAGLLNLIGAGPDHLRPAIFRSLLYEACGRITNPIYGSVGLLSSGNWAQCQSAVDSVLKGTSQFLQSFPSSDQPAVRSAQLAIPPLKYSCDIRHIKKSAASGSSGKQPEVHHRTRVKRVKLGSPEHDEPRHGLWIYPTPIYEETSHRENISTEDDSNFSAETFEDSLAGTAATRGTKKEQIWKFDQPVPPVAIAETRTSDDRDSTIGLELTLGLARV